jgi:hypothetical protein
MQWPPLPAVQTVNVAVADDPAVQSAAAEPAMAAVRAMPAAKAFRASFIEILVTVGAVSGESDGQGLGLRLTGARAAITQR